MAFMVNDTEFNTIEVANWEFEQHSQKLSLSYIYNDQKIHTWLARVMSVTDWEVLRGLRGRQIGLTTTNHEDRNNATHRLYPNAMIETLNGEHVAEHVENVEVRFTVL